MNKTFRRSKHMFLRILTCLAGLLLLLQAACAPQNMSTPIVQSQPNAVAEIEPTPSALPTRPQYGPGELVDYTAQTGDTLPALAAHFNTTVEAIMNANSIIPRDVTTLPPGLPMQIPIYYQSLWGSSFQIIPDSLFIYGPAQIDFDAVSYVASSPGWFKNYSTYGGGNLLTGGQIINHIATNFSISPRLLIAILEYQVGAITRITPPDEENPYTLGLISLQHKGLYAQLVLAANKLNNAYYGWRAGELRSIESNDGRLEIPDPWQNAATVALHAYFAQTLTQTQYEHAIHGDGLIAAYTNLFGDPWENVKPHIPGSLEQPVLTFPFQPGFRWAYTGGPHTGWGDGQPFAAVDFAPPSVVGGCVTSDEWVTAMADGVIVRTGTGIAVLDLDGDGSEQTGWVIFYLHLASRDKVKTGMQLKAGDRMGHPSCEGGASTGTHVHIARKYNGEWIMADSPLALNMEGWIAHNGSAAYAGTLERYGKVIQACVCSDFASQVQSEAYITSEPEE